MPDWIAARGGSKQSDILNIAFTHEEEFEWIVESIGFEPRPNILIEKNAIIQKDFQYTILQAGKLEIYAGAFFFTADIPYGTQITTNVTIIYVQ